MDIAEEYTRHLDEAMAATEGFVITDDTRADWALRKIAQARQNIVKRAEFVAGEALRLRNWQQAADKRDQDTIDFMESLLRQYFESLRQSGALGKRKSYTLPHGALKVRTKGIQFARDEQAMLKWAAEHRPEVIEHKPALRWGELKKDVEVLDGAIVHRGTGRVMDGIKMLDETTGVDADGSVVEGLNVLHGWVVVDKRTGMMVPGLQVATPAGEEFSVDVDGLTGEGE